MQPFETEHLLFRPLAPEDLEDLYGLYSDPQVMRYVTGEPRNRSQTETALDRHLGDHRQFGYGLCAAIDRADGRLVGRCGLIPWREVGPWQAELAWLFAPRCWGRGYGTEFGREMLVQAWGPLGLDYLMARTYQANPASEAIMRKLGMRRVRVLPEEVYYEIRKTASKASVD